MARLSELKGRKRVVVNFEGVGVPVVYRPHALTPAIVAELEEVERDNPIDDGESALVQHSKLGVLVRAQLCALLESWEVEDDEGQPVPIEFESLAAVPFPFLNACLAACMEASRPDPLPAAVSSATSPTVADSVAATAD